MRRVGLFCGLFDPIHAGHLKAAAEALSEYSLDIVYFCLLEKVNGRKGYASLHERWVLCETVLRNETRFQLNKDLKALQESLKKEGSMCYLLCESDEIASDGWLNLQVIPTKPEWHLEALSDSIRQKAACYEDDARVLFPVLQLMAENGLYQRNDLPKLQTMMNAHRYQHTLGVRREAVRLAGIHHVSVQKAALAGLLHDCAKGMKLEALQKIAIENGIVKDAELLTSNAMLHGPVGAYVAQQEFGVTDADVLAAIRNHTLGRPGMSPLELTIFVADATEAGREPYEGLEEIRRLSDISLRCAALKSMHCTRLYLERENKSYCKLARQTELDLLGNLTDTEKMEMHRAGYVAPHAG